MHKKCGPELISSGFLNIFYNGKNRDENTYFRIFVEEMKRECNKKCIKSKYMDMRGSKIGEHRA